MPNNKEKELLRLIRVRKNLQILYKTSSDLEEMDRRREELKDLNKEITQLALTI